MKLSKLHNFFRLQVFLFREISSHAKRGRSQTTKLCHFVNFMTCPNYDSIEKKIIYWFDSYAIGDPRVYKPVCYEMLVAIKYYADVKR